MEAPIVKPSSGSKCHGDKQLFLKGPSQWQERSGKDRQVGSRQRSNNDIEEGLRKLLLAWLTSHWSKPHKGNKGLKMHLHTYLMLYERSVYSLVSARLYLRLPGQHCGYALHTIRRIERMRA